MIDDGSIFCEITPRRQVTGHNGHNPKRPQPKRPQTGMATDRNGHKPERPQTGTATNLNGHRPERPQTETATDRNGHKPKRPHQLSLTTSVITWIYMMEKVPYVTMISMPNSIAIAPRDVTLGHAIVSKSLTEPMRPNNRRFWMQIIVCWWFHAFFTWILVITATNRNGQNLNGHKPKRPQTETATDRNGHRPERPQTGTATNRNGHKPKRPQIEIDTTISDSVGYKFVCSIEGSN